jgi:alkylation response protein AidB-like acyl-CoA dehydrogenase
VRDGDRFVVNGQKVWTSGANYAEFCFLFCRTDPDAPKHKGISILLVDMDTPGLTVRPLPEIVGRNHPDLNEVFLDDVIVPAANLVGQLNNGWVMANGSLAHERGMVWLMGVMRLEQFMRDALAEAPPLLDALPAAERAVRVDELMRRYTDATATRTLGYRGFTRLVRGGTAPEQALMKAFVSEAQRDLALTMTELQGARATDTTGTAHVPEFDWLERYFWSYGGTISAGSSEIQRNIISERVLGLPRA